MSTTSEQQKLAVAAANDVEDLIGHAWQAAEDEDYDRLERIFDGIVGVISAWRSTRDAQ